MRAELFFFLCIFTAASALGETKAKDPKTFDVYVAPHVGVSAGSYKADDADEGSTLGYDYGARAGFKLGPVLIGGEFASTNATRSSNASGVTTANSTKYAVNTNGTFTGVGFNLGLMSDRWALWLSYFPFTKLEAESRATVPAVNYSYSGQASGADINFRVYERLYVGLFVLSREFTKYSTPTIADTDLDPKLRFTSYGISVSYLVSLSDIDTIAKKMPGH